MRILTVLELNGPNIWASSPAAEARVALGVRAAQTTREVLGFNERLRQLIPALHGQPGVDGTSSFGENLTRGVPLSWVLERVARELHGQSYLPSLGSQTVPAGAGHHRVVLLCEAPAFGRLCLERAQDLVSAVTNGAEFDLLTALRQLGEQADKICLGPSTRAIVRAARAQGIPAIRLSTGNLVQLGYCKQQRRIWTAETDGTGAIAESIAQDKELTRRLLGAVGIPVPVGRAVSSPEDCWQAAQELGLPVVVKPQDGNHGRGVSIRLEAQQAVEAAYRFAANEGSGVVVERFVPGTQYRVLVVGQRAIAAAGSEADQVVGDGQSSVEELVAAANLDPLRGEDSAQPLTTLVLDEISLELLRRQGLTASTVPAVGRNVIIHYNGDLTLDVTDRMHPEVANQCALAARTIGLDIAGIDIISESISLPLEQIGGAVIEVNASPALGVHLKPLIGMPRPVGEAIVEHMFGTGTAPLVPVVAVSGVRSGTRICRAIARMAAAEGVACTVADSAGLMVGQRLLAREDSANARGQTRALMNPFVDLAVLEVSAQQVLREGLQFDRSLVVVITGLQALPGAPAERPEPETAWYNLPDDTAAAARLALSGLDSLGTAVLNADEPAVLALSPECPGKVALYTTAANHPAVLLHIERGGTACVCEGSTLWLWRDGEKSRVGAPGTGALGDTARDLDLARSDLAAAVAAAAVLGIDDTNLVAGLDVAVAELGR